MTSAVSRLLPHGAPLVYLDEIKSNSEECVSCLVTPGKEGTVCLFNADGSVPVVMAIEYMAQTAAAWAGLTAVRVGGGRVRQGLLLAVRSLDCFTESFAEGKQLEISARRMAGNDDTSIFRCSISEVGGRMVVEGVITVLLTD